MWFRSSPSRLRPSVRLGGALLAVVALSAALAACGEAVAEQPPSPAPGQVTVIDSAQAAALRAQQGTVVADVRTLEEYREGHVVGAQHIPLEDPELWAQRVAALDPSGTVVVYCRSGRRSAEAAQLLVQAGFESVYDAGGIIDFVEGDLPINR